MHRTDIWKFLFLDNKPTIAVEDPECEEDELLETSTSKYIQIMIVILYLSRLIIQDVCTYY